MEEHGTVVMWICLLRCGSVPCPADKTGGLPSGELDLKEVPDLRVAFFFFWLVVSVQS